MTNATVDEFLAALRSEVGYTECPRDGLGRCRFTGHGGGGRNHTKFAAEAGLPNGVYWCHVCPSALAKRTQLAVPKGAITASTREGRMAWIQADRWVGAVSAIRPGDWVYEHLTGRNGPGQPDHVEVCLEAPSAGRIVTIGANTSSSEHGSQDNGGGVYIRTRPLKVVLGAGRPPYGVSAETPHPHPHRFEEDDVFNIIGYAGGSGRWYFWPQLERKALIKDGAALAEAMKGDGYGGYLEMDQADLRAIPYVGATKKAPAD